MVVRKDSTAVQGRGQGDDVGVDRPKIECTGTSDVLACCPAEGEVGVVVGVGSIGPLPDHGVPDKRGDSRCEGKECVDREMAGVGEVRRQRLQTKLGGSIEYGGGCGGVVMLGH